MSNKTNNHWYLGIDVGASKTSFCLVDDQNTIISQTELAGANPHNQDVSQTSSLLSSGVTHLYNQALQKHQKNSPPISICVGFAGLDTKTDQHHCAHILDAVTKTLPFSPKQVSYCSDGLIGLFSHQNNSWGICVIASTGSNCFGLSKDRNLTASAGNWGYVFGDQGSAYHVGLYLIQQALKEYDGRTKPTGLIPLLLGHGNWTSFEQVIALSHTHPPSVADIASCAKLLPDLPNNTQEQLLSQLVTHHLESIKAVINQIDLTPASDFPVICIGGLFHNQAFSDQLHQAIQTNYPQATIARPSKSPVFGAINLLIWHTNNPESSISSVYRI